MGTSKGYSAPTTPQWSRLKGDVTRVSKNGSVPSDTARSIVRDFVRTNGGAELMSGGGGGGTGGSHQAAPTAGRRLANFTRSVASSGLSAALREIGLGELIGKSAGEITLSLLNKLCEDGSTFDEVDARNAMSDLTNELLKDTTSYEQVEAVLEQKFTLEALEGHLLTFFGYYLYHHFCRAFFDRLCTKHGEQVTIGFLGSIRDFISSELKVQTFGKNLSQVDWSGDEGKAIASEIMHSTLMVFEGG
jgi:hypothetical protein